MLCRIFVAGLELDLLQKYLFIPLDIFRENLHNKGIENKLDAWLAFLSCDEPKVVAAIIERYPEFRLLYEQAYDICKNVERMMEMFSKELLELDRNTVQYMIDEMQEEINKQREELTQKEETIQQNEEMIQQQTLELDRQKVLYEQALQKIRSLEAQQNPGNTSEIL